MSHDTTARAPAETNDRATGLKLGVVGKGGVGKTTTSSLIAAAYARQGRRVVAVDTDSNPNLGLSLGMSFDEIEAIPVLPRAIIVGHGGDVTVDELLGEYGRATPVGPTLLSAIRVSEAGAGCTCAGHATVRSLLGEALDEYTDVTVVDMEAGLEHLSRSGGTLAHADVLVVVMEPSQKSVITAARTVELAAELGLDRVYGLGNKARDDEDVAFFERACAQHGVPLAGVLPFQPAVRDADRTGVGIAVDPPEDLRQRLDEILAGLERPTVSTM